MSTNVKHWVDQLIVIQVNILEIPYMTICFNRMPAFTTSNKSHTVEVEWANAVMKTLLLSRANHRTGPLGVTRSFTAFHHLHQIDKPSLEMTVLTIMEAENCLVTAGTQTQPRLFWVPGSSYTFNSFKHIRAGDYFG